MEKRPDFFPVYVSGQYLTSEHLNETHNFLWQQEKATRYLVAGNGIISGMLTGTTNNTPMKQVSVTPGAAVTCDGYIIEAGTNLSFQRAVSLKLSWYKTLDGAEQLMEKVLYDKIEDKKKANIDPASEVVLDAFELIADDVANEDLPVNTKALETFGTNSAFLVVAWVDITDAENNHCQQGDCNSKGIQRNFKTRYFLMNNQQLPFSNTMKAQLSLCSVKRIKNLSQAGSVAGLNQKSFEAWSSSVADLAVYFSAAGPLKSVADLLDQPIQNDFTTIVVPKFAQLVSSASNTNCMQYYNLFAGDLAKAINELANFYDGYVNRYPIIKKQRIERTIVLGMCWSIPNVEELNDYNDLIDNYRYYFLPAPPQLQYRADKKRLKRLLRRIMYMVQSFIPQASLQSKTGQVSPKPQAIPSIVGCDALLQNCAIPYYYDLNTVTEFLRYWNPNGITTDFLNNVFCYYDPVIRNNMAAKLTSTDWYNYNFFRIEGHIGMTKNAAITAIANLIKNQGLPIQLLDCDITNKGPQKWTEFYGELVANLSLWIKDVRKNYTEYTFDPLKHIHTNVTQTSYRDVDTVIKMMNDFNAFTGVMYNPPAAQKLKAKSLGAGTSNAIPPTAYEQYSKVVKKEAVMSLNKKYKEALADQKETAVAKLLLLSDLVDLEYMGGAIRGGTFVLLHDGDKVIGDGCLPYYYRINQLRIFNPSVA